MTSFASAESLPGAGEPVVLAPVLVERIWGSKDLAPWYASRQQGDALIGEIWLTAEECKAETGPGLGRTLAELTRDAPEHFGNRGNAGFPLLLKLLFPGEKLSVQVHPDDEQAKALGLPRGKTECWYVLSADPGATVAVGFREPLTGAELRAAIEDGSVESKLRTIPVKAGDMVFVDACTVHAIGPGMVVLETQQYSDTTYRLWDYGRPRELHVEAGTAVTRTKTAAGLVEPVECEDYTRLISCDFFAVDRFRLRNRSTTALGEGQRLQILVALEGEARLGTLGGEQMRLPRGQAVVLPAAGQSFLLSSEGGAEVIRVLEP